MSNPNSFYSSSTTSEINLREELIHTLDGFFPEVAKATDGVLRKMNKDNSGNLIECPCVDPVTHEPDRDFFCAVSYNEKYIWTESYINFYKVVTSKSPLLDKSEHPGLINVPQANFYLRYSVDIEKHDKIVEIDLDLEGNINLPVTRVGVWKIQDLVFFRSDNGKVEFIKAFCSLEDVKHLNAP